MKAYGHNQKAPMDCCPGHSDWAVQSKHNKHGPRFNRDASRRPYKKAERRRARRTIINQLNE